MVFIDEINHHEIEDVALFDHNKLDQSQLHLSSKVTKIVDHHFDNHLY